MRSPVSLKRWHGRCHIPIKGFIPNSRRITMKFENLMMQSLFTASLLVCLLALGSMLTTRTVASNIAASHAPVAAVVSSAG